MTTFVYAPRFYHEYFSLTPKQPPFPPQAMKNDTDEGDPVKTHGAEKSEIGGTLARVYRHSSIGKLIGAAGGAIRFDDSRWEL